MTSVPTFFTGEVMLSRVQPFGDAGLVTLALSDSDDLAPFRALLAQHNGRAGQRFMAVLVLVGEQNEPLGRVAASEPMAAEGNYGQAYVALYKAGWFYNPRVSRAVGSDEDYQAWCRAQPSAFSGKADWCETLGEGRCVYAHCRRVTAGAGIALKPEYSGVPLTYEEHALQHAHGEKSALPGFDMEKKAAEYLVTWIKSVLYQQLNTASLATLPPGAFYRWCEAKGLAGTLPAQFMRWVNREQMPIV